MPTATVTLSSFYIDRDMVTARRHRECVAAGACIAPASTADLVGDAVAVHLLYGDAAAFCAWDGGRLPTEYEWEKAARGPAPAASLNSWAGDGGCDETQFCTGRVIVTGASTSISRPAIELLISALPGAYSPWGVHQLGSGVFEFTSTLYAADLEGVAASDPGDRPGAGPERTLRGAGSIHAVEYAPGMWAVDPTIAGGSAVRRRADAGGTYFMNGFRCVY